ncbi:adenylate/guanylate cyclase domain-containing protein [Mucilaginibacter sp. SG564]|uniref:adenylate/guanylate cyclase domain-containing protein n=1 Tax=Mucilaginibacter sp. SG564 TaxID=2587022 RepID=UPI0015526490|nr:adenylate/guanylate cyclase domain-containing protein [Mucilaginibacter sp. SG564]NOW96021.1 class 3 adenylate cyclase [Mucilaginibacter sp. SG564]
MKDLSNPSISRQYLQSLLYGEENDNAICIEKSQLDCTHELWTKQHNEIIESEKDLAILFLDIRHFTDLLERRPVKDILKIVGRLFTIFNKIITNFHGRIIERTGDNLYAVFGLQENLKQAANHAYQSAKMMFDALDILNENYFRDVYGYPLEMGIGLHAGHVYIGQFEFENYSPMTVMGLPVNIAARLQTETKTQNNDLIISEEAFQYLDLFHIYLPKTINIRGVSKSQKVWLAGKPFSQQTIDNRYELEMASLLAMAG